MHLPLQVSDKVRDRTLRVWRTVPLPEVVAVIVVAEMEMVRPSQLIDSPEPVGNQRVLSQDASEYRDNSLP